MSPPTMRRLAVLLVLALVNTSCGSALEEMRPDGSITAPPRASGAVAASPNTHEWSGLFEDLDEVVLVTVPYTPRKLRFEDVTQEEFRAFMVWALRDVNLPKWKAELDPSFQQYGVMEASWWGAQVEPKDILITQKYLETCQREDPRSCISLPPGAALTSFQRYRVALGIGMSRFLAGFVMELGDEARAMLDPAALKTLMVGAMVSYLVLLANPDPIFTKALAAAATVVVTAMLGARTVCDVAFGFRDMVRQVDAARTYAELAEAGRQYGEKLGASTARILVMAVMALLNKEGAVAKLLGFPKLPQASAALLADTGGVLSLKSLGQVAGVKVLSGGLSVAMVEASGKVALKGAPAPATGSAPTTTPAPTEQITLPPGVTGYDSWSALKAELGTAGEGQEWHHIVEKCKADMFGSRAVHNRWNVIKLDRETHLNVSAEYSRIRSFSEGKTVREWLRTKSYVFQREFGLKTLRELGVKIP